MSCDISVNNYIYLSINRYASYLLLLYLPIQIGSCDFTCDLKCLQKHIHVLLRGTESVIHHIRRHASETNTGAVLQCLNFLTNMTNDTPTMDRYMWSSILFVLPGPPGIFLNFQLIPSKVLYWPLNHESTQLCLNPWLKTESLDFTHM